MIPRNSQFPVSVTKRFYSFRNHQPAVTVDMYEGEKDIAHDNHWLGNYNFPIPDGSKYHAGERSLEVSVCSNTTQSCRYLQTDSQSLTTTNHFVKANVVWFKINQ
jgi:molecular chaperone DnaK (HSP70)